MIIRQFDYKKNEFENFNNFQFDFKKKENYFRQDLEKEIEIRIQALQDEIDVYINDVNENAIITTTVKNLFEIKWCNHVNDVFKLQKKENACIRQKISTSRKWNHEHEMKREINLDFFL